MVHKVPTNGMKKEFALSREQVRSSDLSVVTYQFIKYPGLRTDGRLGAVRAQ